MTSAFSWLPLVQRELGVAVRSRRAYLIRVTVVALALGAGMFSFLFGLGFRSAGQQGKLVFSILGGYAYAVSLLAGVFLAADSLSQEKREGTLGLLFLTDLRGYDVVLGKFAACSINALCGLVALVPVIALPILMGGVTAGEFWRTAASLINTLFFSIATGLTISAFVSQKTSGATRAFGLLLLAGVIGPLAVDGMAVLGVPIVGKIGLLSPWAAFQASDAIRYAADPGRYWAGLALSHLVAWVLLGRVSRQLPRMVRDDPVERPITPAAALRPEQAAPVSGECEGASQDCPRPKRPPVDDAMPVAWLVGEDRSLQAWAWVLALVWGLVAMLMLLSSSGFGSPTPVIYGGKAFSLVLKIMAAMYSTRFFVQWRQTGMLDSLAATPLETTDLVRAQWEGYRRTFLPPVVFILCIQAIPVIGVLWVGRQPVFDSPFFLLSMGGGVFLCAWTGLAMLLDFVALFYFGAWTALSMRQPRYASAVTLLLVLVIPSFVFCSIFPMFSFCGFDMLASLWFVSWSRRRLMEDFRRRLVHGAGP